MTCSKKYYNYFCSVHSNPYLSAVYTPFDFFFMYYFFHFCFLTSLLGVSKCVWPTYCVSGQPWRAEVRNVINRSDSSLLFLQSSPSLSGRPAFIELETVVNLSLCFVLFPFALVKVSSYCTYTSTLDLIQSDRRFCELYLDNSVKLASLSLIPD